jgi:galactokinase
MNESHLSLRHDFEVSCPELDTMVEIAQSLPGVLGSRMTGGGFGGCTVSLVDKRTADRVQQQLATEYFRRTGIEPELFFSRPCASVQILPRPGVGRP